MKKLFVMLLAFVMLLSLAACGEPEETKPSQNSTPAPSDTGSSQPSDGEQVYTFDPPTDNYYIETDTYIQARVGNLYTYWDKEDSAYSYHLNSDLQGLWWYDGSQWVLGWDYTWEEYYEQMQSPAYIFSSMEDGLLRLLGAFGQEEKLFTDYYLGMETVAGIDCWVFDSKGINTLRCKYWVDPSNGCVLKFDHYEEADYTEEIRVYDLNYTVFGADLGPAEYEDPCDHWDSDLSGTCDKCGRSFQKTKLAAPVIFIDDDGDLSWHVEGQWRNTVSYLLRINGVETETDQDGYGKQPSHGDRFQVKAIADPRGEWADSEWSEEFIFEYAQAYEFLNIGLETAQEEALAAYFGNYAPGAYYFFGDLTYYKCENGDLICWDEDGDHQIYTMNGYSYYKLHFDDDGECCYDHYRFGENKREYYNALYFCINAFSWCEAGQEQPYADGTAFIAAQGVSLLDPGSVDGAGGGYELLNYRCYSQSIDRRYIVTGYMHPSTRYFDWLPNFDGKVLYWEVEYINSPWVYVENCVRIQFTADFTHSDFEALRNYLSGQGMTPRYTDSFGAVTPNGYNSFDGQLAIYTMPYEEEGDIWYDTYKLVGYVDAQTGYSLPYLFQADYLYSYWYDGGTNATYVRRLDGLWRVIPTENGDEWMLMISPDGTHHMP